MTTDNEAAAVEAGVFPPAAFEEWFAAVEAGDGSIPVPQSIADGEAWHEYIGRRQIALGAWLAATEAAIAAHTAASGGEVVAEVYEDSTGRRFLRWTTIDFAPVGAKFYTAPPAAVPADALERLVEEMRRESTDDHPMQHRGIPTVHADIRRWADELAALIPKGADHGQD